MNKVSYKILSNFITVVEDWLVPSPPAVGVFTPASDQSIPLSSLIPGESGLTSPVCLPLTPNLIMFRLHEAPLNFFTNFFTLLVNKASFGQ